MDNLWCIWRCWIINSSGCKNWYNTSLQLFICIPILEMLAYIYSRRVSYWVVSFTFASAVLWTTPLICSWHLLISMPAGEKLDMPHSIKLTEETPLDQVCGWRLYFFFPSIWFCFLPIKLCERRWSQIFLPIKLPAHS